MEINRNQYFMAGIVILLLGIQLRMVESYVLNEQATKILVEKFGESEVQKAGLSLFGAAPIARKVIHPPEWAGWLLMSVGSVLILHALAMQKPGG